MVKVRVTEINEKLNRIGLSMRLEEQSESTGKRSDKPRSRKRGGKQEGGQQKKERTRPKKKEATIEDLMRKFNSR